MSTLQRLAAISDATANLTAQLRELNELREQVRKAEQPRDRQGLNPEASQRQRLKKPKLWAEDRDR